MSLNRFVRQLNPIQENKVIPLIKIQKTISESSEDISAVMKGLKGKDAEAVYEAWAFIVAKLNGKKTLPSISDVKSSMSEKEFNDVGKKWINNYIDKTEDTQYLMKAIELIGGDMKDIPNVNWGSVQIIHKNINNYYKNTPKKYISGAKENTADMILVVSGSTDALIKEIPNAELNWGENGVISIDGTNIKFIQVSLKKGQDTARIGKLSSLINQIYGQQAMMPSKLIGEDIQYMEEGLRDIFGKAASLISLGFKKLMNFAGRVLTKLKNSIVKSAIKITKTIIKDKAHKSSAKLSKLFGFDLSESLQEKVLPPVTINQPMLREMKILKSEIIQKDLANKEYEKMLQLVDAINSKKDGAIVMRNKGTDPKLEMNNFKAAADEVLSKKVGDTITRENINPAFKLVVNYASYRTFNTILSDMFKNIENYQSITEALVGLNAKMRAESMFGKTALPLWIVYGMGGGAHYKHTKDEFEAKSKEEIESMGASMNVPYMVISIAKSTKNPTYNAIYGYVLVNASKDTDGLQPQYMEMQFIIRSGSTWSYKIDANKIVTGVPK